MNKANKLTNGFADRINLTIDELLQQNKMLQKENAILKIILRQIREQHPKIVPKEAKLYG